MDNKKWHKVWEPGVPKYLEPQKSLPDYFKDQAIRSANNVALHFFGLDITYEFLDKQIDKFAGGLVDLGVNKGDRIALFMPNCPQFIICYFGALRAGAIVVSLNTMFRHAELEYELTNSGAEILVSMDYLFPEVQKTRNNIELKHIIITSFKDYPLSDKALNLIDEMQQPKMTFPGTIEFMELLDSSQAISTSRISDLKNDIALLQFTGGTTGLPKGAIISHYALAHNIIATGLFYKYTSSDVHLGIMPFFHVQGMVQSMGASITTGGKLVILPRFSPELLARTISKHKCTIWQTNTTMIMAMLQWPDLENYDLSSLRVVWYGGALMPGEIAERLHNILPNAIFGEGYGLSETISAGGAITPPSHPKPGTVGIPNISVDIKIVDLETGSKEVNPDEEGEIIIKTPGMLSGYWNSPEDTKSTLRDGWFHTGDIGKMDNQGYLTFTGRKKELIKCSGFSVFPSEVEDLLYKNPVIAEVAVIGVYDAYRGETPKAFIVLKPEYNGKVTEEDIIVWSKEHIAAYKRPRVIEFREKLPKNSVGKVLRIVLADEEKQRSYN